MSEFLLKTDPDAVICFANEKLGEEPITTVLKITNDTEKHFSYKVKCTSNEIFRIRPPLGFLSPKETVDIRVIFFFLKFWYSLFNVLFF